MLKNRSNLLAVFTVLVLVLLPLSYFTVSVQLERQSNDDLLLNRLTFIGGAVQRLIKMPEHPSALIADIDDAFISSEKIYPALLHPTEAEAALAHDYAQLHACWETIKKEVKTSPDALNKHGEICWLNANKALFDLHYIMEQKRKAMLNSLFILAFFGALVLLYLLYQIFKYVRTDLEKHQLVDTETGLFNTRAFLEECVRNCISSSRNGLPYSVILMKFPDSKSDARKARAIAEQLKKSCRREEKLFKLSPASYALMTTNAKKADLSPLIERLKANVAVLQNSFMCDILEYTAELDVEAFGPACLQRLENMGEAVH